MCSICAKPIQVPANVVHFSCGHKSHLLCAQRSRQSTCTTCFKQDVKTDVGIDPSFVGIKHVFDHMRTTRAPSWGCFLSRPKPLAQLLPNAHTDLLRLFSPIDFIDQKIPLATLLKHFTVAQLRKHRFTDDDLKTLASSPREYLRLMLHAQEVTKMVYPMTASDILGACRTITDLKHICADGATLRSLGIRMHDLFSLGATLPQVLDFGPPDMSFAQFINFWKPSPHELAQCHRPEIIRMHTLWDMDFVATYMAKHEHVPHRASTSHTQPRTGSIQF